MSFLGVFDYPIIDTNCARRTPSATPLQSLTLLNDGFIWDSAAALAEAAAGDIDQAYIRALARKPTPKERDFAASYLVANPFRGLAHRYSVRTSSCTSIEDDWRLRWKPVRAINAPGGGGPLSGSPASPCAAWP